MASPFVFVFFTACGGGGDDAPPQAPTSSPLAAGTEGNKQHMEELIKKLLSGQDKSCEDAGLKALSAFALANQGTVAGSLPPDIGKTCADILNQIIWNATRIKYANEQPWINDPIARKWLIAKIGRFLVGVGAKAGAQFGISPALLATLSGPMLAFVNKYILPRLSQGSDPRLLAELANYGLSPTSSGAVGGTFGYAEPGLSSLSPFGSPNGPGGFHLPPDVIQSLPPLPYP